MAFHTSIFLWAALFSGLTDTSATLTNFRISNSREHVVNIITTSIEEIIFDYNYPVLTIRLAFESKNDYHDGFLLAQEILLKLKPSVKVVIQTKPCPSMSDWQPATNLWIIEGLNSFERILSWSPYISYKPSGKYIVVYLGLKTDIEDIFEILFNYNVINILVVFLDKNTTVSKYSFAPYSIASDCSSLNVQEIKVNTDFLLPEQFQHPMQNLNKCPLKVVVKQNPPFMALHTSFGDVYWLGGLEGKALSVVADRRNFTMEVTEVDTMDYLQEPNDKKVQSGLVTAVIIVNAALGAGGFVPTSSFGTSYVSLVNFHVYSDLVIAVPRLPRFGDYVQISLPFRTSSWILIGTAFVSMVGFTCLLRKLKPSLRFAIVGRLSDNPIQSLIVTGLGQSISRDPEKSFARSLVLFWVLLTFVIRNVYLAKQYDIIRADTKYWAFETYEDIEQSGLPVYVHKQYCDFISEKQLTIRTICYNGTSKQILDKIREENFRGAFLTARMDINYHDVKQQKVNLLSKTILTLRDFKIEIRTLLILSKNSPLKGMLTKDLLRLGGSGLLSKWVRDYMTPRSNDNTEPFELSFQNVDAIFQIFGWGMTVSFILFLGEVILKRL